MVRQHGLLSYRAYRTVLVTKKSSIPSFLGLDSGPEGFGSRIVRHDYFKNEALEGTVCLYTCTLLSRDTTDRVRRTEA